MQRSVSVSGACVVLDNGAGRIKYGLSGDDIASGPRSLPNCMAKMDKQMQVLVGDQVQAVDNSSLLKFTRPFERGYMVNGHCQIEIWKRLFETPSLLGGFAQPEATSLVFTEPPFSPEPIQNDMNEIVFEQFGFKEYLRRPAAWFSAYEFAAASSSAPSSASSSSRVRRKDDDDDDDDDDGADTVDPAAAKSALSAPRSCCLVIDAGFSFAHALPFIDGKCQKSAVKRVNVGGKLLTNHLKSLVSLRQYNMNDEFLLVDQVKESLCYVSTDFSAELGRCARAAGVGGKPSPRHGGREGLVDFRGDAMRQAFVLPDFQKISRGFVRPPDMMDGGEQLLTLETERFSVPEVLFHPGDIGMNQCGVAEAAWQSLQDLSEVEMGLAAAHIVLTGGNCCLPQFQDRFAAEIRQLVPGILPVETHLPPRPQDYAWAGAAHFVEAERAAGRLSQHMVTRAEYLECGHEYTNDKFFRGW